MWKTDLSIKLKTLKRSRLQERNWRQINQEMHIPQKNQRARIPRTDNVIGKEKSRNCLK